MNNELETYINQIKTSYCVRYTGSAANPAVLDQMEKEFCEGLKFTTGKVYIKVISKTSVHSFIVLKDGTKFKKGDILKAASWKTPALNFARGNLFNPASFKNVSWTGA